MTLIELLFVVAILGALLALALPNFSDTIEAANTNSQVKVMLTTLNLARSESIRRGVDVSICASNDGLDCDADAWADGWIVFIDNNADANGANGSVDGGDEIIRVFDSLGAGSAADFSVDMLSYNSMGFSATGGVQNFVICPASNNTDNARSIEIGPSGRGRRIETGLACPPNP